MTAGATASPWSVPSSRPPRCSEGQGSQRAQPLTRSRTPPLCTAASARPLPHPGGPRLQSAGPGAGPAASALRPRPSHPAPPRRPPSPRPAVLHHTLRAVGPAPGGGMCHLTPTALATPAGQVAGSGKPAQRRWAPLWARPAGAPGSWPSRTPQSRGRKGLGPRRLPVGTPPPAHTTRCQAAAATGPLPPGLACHPSPPSVLTPTRAAGQGGGAPQPPREPHFSQDAAAGTHLL